MRSGGCVLAVAIISLVVSASIPAQECEPGLDGEEYMAVLDRLMPLEGDGRAGVRCRLHQDSRSEYPEVWLEVMADYQGLPVRARLRTSAGDSLHTQLWRMSCESPESSLLEFVPRLQTREWSLTSETCPALEGRPWDFSTATSSQMEKIFLHPLVFEVASRLGNVDARFTLVDPEDGPAKWALEVLEDLEDCVIRKDPTASFLDSRAGQSPKVRWERIRRVVRTQISKEQTFYVHDTVRLDFDRDGEPDLLFVYEVFAGEMGDELIGTWLRWLPGQRSDGPAVHLVDPPKLVGRIRSAKPGELVLDGRELDSWPVKVDVRSRPFTVKILLREGHLEPSIVIDPADQFRADR